MTMMNSELLVVILFFNLVTRDCFRACCSSLKYTGVSPYDHRHSHSHTFSFDKYISLGDLLQAVNTTDTHVGGHYCITPFPARANPL